MTRFSRWTLLGSVSLTLAFWTGRAPAQSPAPPANPATDVIAVPETPPAMTTPILDMQAGSAGSNSGDPQPLTLANFFTAGWDEDFTRRSSDDRAPDFALLRVQTNFMERELRVNYFFEDNITSKTRLNINSMDYFLAYGFNRRFMLEVLGNYEWIDGRGTAPSPTGPDGQLIGRVQLISTEDSSYSFNFRFISPQTWIPQDQTTISYGIAGFEDLTGLGLYRVGLYGSFLFDTLIGPGAVGAAHNDVQYDVSIAKTLTKPDTPLIGNFTVFVEAFAQTNVDGDLAGRTVASITPAVRFNLGKAPGLKFGLDNWILFGVDLPVCGPLPWAATYRLSYIKNF